MHAKMYMLEKNKDKKKKTAKKTAWSTVWSERANEIGFLVSMAANCEATCALGVVKEDVRQLSRRDETRSRAERRLK